MVNPRAATQGDAVGLRRPEHAYCLAVSNSEGGASLTDAEAVNTLSKDRGNWLPQAEGNHREETAARPAGGLSSASQGLRGLDRPNRKFDTGDRCDVVIVSCCSVNDQFNISIERGCGRRRIAQKGPISATVQRFSQNEGHFCYSSSFSAHDHRRCRCTDVILGHRIKS
jgi:hypothetical protein